MFARTIIVATLVSLSWSVGAYADPLAELGDYETRAVFTGLRDLRLQIEPNPEGKIVGSIWVLNLEIFDAKDGFLRSLNYLHRTTRPYVIEREVLLRPGDAFNWEMIRESERNLSSPLWSMLVVIVPVRAERPGVLDLLVVTRDSWSLRTDSAFEVQAGVLSRLSMEPSDFNFLGLRKQVGLRFDMDLSEYSVGPLFEDPNMFGSHVESSYSASLVFNRQTNELEGSASEVQMAYPLWSLSRTWGARVRGSHHDFVSRLFQDVDLYTYDAPETADDDAIPWQFDMREAALDIEFVRATGRRFKNRFFLAYEMHVQRPGVRADFEGDELVRQSFIRDVLPRSERTSAMVLRYHVFQPKFARYRSIETFDLSENEQVGLDMTLEAAGGTHLLASEVDFVRLGANLSFTADLGDGFLRVHGSGSTRIEDGRPSDTNLDLEARLVTPTLARIMRLVTRGRIARRFDDRQNIVFPVGGETGLRGYVIGAFVGSAMAIANIEARSSPVSLGFTKIGATAFWDVGHAADSLGDLQVFHDVGAGIRVLVPQFGHELLRLDWAFALRGPTARWPGRISIGYQQAF